MAAVTTVTDAGSQILALLEEERVAHPTLSEQHSLARVRDRNPELFAQHHAGANEPAELTVDPGQDLNEIAYRKVERKEAIDHADGLRQAMKENPAMAAAYQSAQRLPTDAVTQREIVGPVRMSSDPGRELCRLVELELAATHGTVDQATKAVLRRDPVLARHYSEATPLPMVQTRERTSTDNIVAAGLTSIAKLRQDLAEIARMTGPGYDPLNPSARRHYSELSPAERARHFPFARPLGRGEALRDGEVRVEKMAGDAADGGSWAVRECAA